jgi:hypothetical protein
METEKETESTKQKAYNTDLKRKNIVLLTILVICVRMETILIFERKPSL